MKNTLKTKEMTIGVCEGKRTKNEACGPVRSISVNYRPPKSKVLQLIKRTKGKLPHLVETLTKGALEQLIENAGPLLRASRVAHAPQALRARKFSTDCAEGLYSERQRRWVFPGTK
ncbi:hypothetical protein Y032_0003g1672 [Ancylostoma ceylanicum]|uniref:Uncharacterized protein n=1 Tax=Ancylostoma ceylanicum TaxID=53326 RepID=A0A016VZ58_9BILA|nr:hypothetical protein Y032_0003g1672 [Ancylostoma ceylanicum]